MGKAVVVFDMHGYSDPNTIMPTFLVRFIGPFCLGRNAGSSSTGPTIVEGVSQFMQVLKELSGSRSLMLSLNYGFNVHLFVSYFVKDAI